MVWEVETFFESFRYGKLISPFRIVNGWHHCYRVRRKKNKVFLDKTEVIVAQLPTYKDPAIIAEIGDLIFVHDDRSSSLLRDEPDKPFFKKYNKKGTLLTGLKEPESPTS